MKTITYDETQWQLVPKEPNKVREAILASLSKLTKYGHGEMYIGDDCDFGPRADGGFYSVQEVTELFASMAAQAPVREVPGWISVADRLPEFRHECTTSGCDVSDSLLIYGETAFGAKGCGFGHGRDDGTWQCYEAVYDQLTVIKVTHWMPLPAAPVQQEGE